MSIVDLRRHCNSPPSIDPGSPSTLLCVPITPGPSSTAAASGTARPPGISSNHAVALMFAKAGFPVFPCDALSKRPLTPRGFHAATIDDRAITRWWREYPEALVGLPTSHFWVLDIDAKPSLATSIADLLELLGIAKATLAAACGLVVTTPGGGRHVYFARTPGVSIRTTAGDIAPSVDTRGHDADGRPTGYVIAPTCVLPDGRTYRVVQGSLASLFALGVRA